MAQVGAARTACGLSAYPPQTVVWALGNKACAEGFPEAGPAAAGIELFGTGEEGLITDDAAVGARPLIVPVFTSEWSFGSSLLGAVVLHGRQARTELLVCFIGTHGYRR